MKKFDDMDATPKPIAGVVYAPPEQTQYYRKNGALGQESLGSALHNACNQYADRTALIAPDEQLSYRQLDELSDQTGAALLELGLKPQDRVIFQIENTVEIFFLLYGCFKVGVIPVCTLASHREHEIAHLAEFTGARAHFIQADISGIDMLAFAENIRDKVGTLEHIVTVRGESGEHGNSVIALKDAMARIDVKAAREVVSATHIHPDDVALFQLSGGTTGIPKVIPRFHAEYIHNSLCYAIAADFTENSIAHWPLPAIHNAAMVQFNLPIHLTGGALAVQRSHATKDFFGMIQRHRVTHSGAALPLIVRAIDSGTIGDYDLSSLIDFVSLGESELVANELHLPANHIFGMAEGLCMRSRSDDPLAVRSSMIGRPLSPFDEVKIVDPRTGDEVQCGEVGEFWARGPYTTRGYYDATEYNAGKFSTDGFYQTGDLMKAHVIDDVTYFSFEGRTKDNIDRGMEKISAEELEREIIHHDSVREVYCVAMPDREYGEKVCAYIITKQDFAGLTVPQLGRFLGTRGVAKFKWPEHVELVDTFPTTKVGKTSKALLREDITRKLVTAGRLPPSYLQQYDQ